MLALANTTNKASLKSLTYCRPFLNESFLHSSNLHYNITNARASRAPETLLLSLESTATTYAMTGISLSSTQGEGVGGEDYANF